MNLITSSLAQLELDSQSTGGPISRLPNELVQSILSRLDMRELISMKVVCKKWQAVICSIGYKKKSLFMTKYDIRILSCVIYRLKKRSFGQINGTTFTYIKVKPFRNEHFPSQLVNLFPNIESIAMDLPLSGILAVLPHLNQLTTLSITFDPSTPIASNDEMIKLLKLINSCVSLKRLDIKAQINCQMSILAPTLARLEQFSYSSYEPSLVGHFGLNCSRVSFLDFELELLNTNFYQWHTINGQWLANLTHIYLRNVNNFDRGIDYLSKHAVSLQMMRLEALGLARMTPQLIGQLSTLKYLIEIDLEGIFIELPQLDQARRDLHLARLGSLRICTFVHLNLYSNTGLVRFTDSEMNKTQSALFASLLSTILPNVEHLNITINYSSYEILQGVESYLDSFSKLQTHSFKTRRLKFYGKIAQF